MGGTTRSPPASISVWFGYVSKSFMTRIFGGYGVSTVSLKKSSWILFIETGRLTYGKRGNSGAWPNLAALKVDDLDPVIVGSQLSNLAQMIGCMISGSPDSGVVYSRVGQLWSPYQNIRLGDRSLWQSRRVIPLVCLYFHDGVADSWGWWSRWFPATGSRDRLRHLIRDTPFAIVNTLYMGVYESRRGYGCLSPGVVDRLAHDLESGG